jgi:hypothetical protein
MSRFDHYYAKFAAAFVRGRQLQGADVGLPQHLLDADVEGLDDADLEAVLFAEIAGRNLVVEEKIDGANCGISFSPEGQLLLQSRGHYLTGGAREKHFNLFKQWAQVHSAALWDRIGSRYVVYGEWLYAKHTVFYDWLTHYFLEFDILDTQTGQFLSTRRGVRSCWPDCRSPRCRSCLPASSSG